MSQITEQEIQSLINHIQKLDPGYYPFELFIEFCRLLVLPAVELVPYCKINNEIKILFIPRDKDDKFWPGIMHTPGTILRPTDKQGSYNDALNRIYKDEIPDVKILHDPIFFKTYYQKTNRGQNVAIVHYVEIEYDSRLENNLFSLNNLLENNLPEQIEFINEIARTIR